MPVYTLSDVEVDFPYEAYPCQLQYMTSVIEALKQGQNALLESPTGTGKTLCLLTATLGWREHLRRQIEMGVATVQQNPHASSTVQGLREAFAEYKAEQAAQGRGPNSTGLPLIVYSSRTHSQLAQVMRELRKCTYRPRTAILSSRQQTCLHPVVRSQPAGANQACRALVSRSGCKWHYGVERFAKHNPDANTEVLDIEDLNKLGEARQLCPYYLGRELAATADLVFMPYNYLITPQTRAGLGLCWENAVIIFDEAHNVENVCADAGSFDLPASAVGGAIEELGTAAELAASKGDAPVNVFNELGGQDKGPNYLKLATELRQAQLVLQRLEREIAAVPLNPELGFTAPGAYLFDLLAKLNLTSASWPVLLSTLDQASSLLSAEAVDAGRRSGSRSSAHKLSSVSEALTLAFASEQPLRPGQPPAHLGYRVHVHMQKHAKTGQQSPTLSYWCFWPGQAMQQLAEMKVRSILLTSGTLSPLETFAHELSLAFPIKLENPHVIAPSQAWCGVVPVGPLDGQLNSSYAHRDSQSYKDELGLSIANFARLVPDGLLVFFPSYGAMQSCLDSWRQPSGNAGSSIWERITAHKAPVVEPRFTEQFGAAVDDFKAKLDNPAFRGAVFFAVMRGKASEGLDFSDRCARAVVITGIPFATKTDPRVRLKQEVLNDACRAQRKKRPVTAPPAAAASGGGHVDLLTGEQWYSQEAMRAVNQAMGRVIRHRADYGAVILCDERYKGQGIRKQLSRWLRDTVVVHPSFGAASASLTRFFKQHQQSSGREAGRQAPVPGSGPAADGQGRAGLLRDAVGGSKGPSGPLLLQIPAASCMVGIAELVSSAVPAQAQPAEPAAAAAGRPGGTGHAQANKLQQLLDQPETAASEPVAGAAAGGSAAQQGAARLAPKPWQQIMAPLRPGGGPPRPSMVSGPTAPALAGSAAGGNVVGPAGRLQQYREGLQQQQRAGSMECEQRQQPPQQPEQYEQQQQQERPGPSGAKKVQEPPPAAAPAPFASAAAAEVVPGAAAAQRQQPEAPQAGPKAPDTAAEGSSGSSKQAKASIESFITVLKVLPKNGHAIIIKALKAYRAERQADVLIDTVVPVLWQQGGAQRALLLGTFRSFCPSSGRLRLDELLARLQQESDLPPAAQQQQLQLAGPRDEPVLRPLPPPARPPPRPGQGQGRGQTAQAAMAAPGRGREGQLVLQQAPPAAAAGKGTTAGRSQAAAAAAVSAAGRGAGREWHGPAGQRGTAAGATAAAAGRGGPGRGTLPQRVPAGVQAGRLGPATAGRGGRRAMASAARTATAVLGNGNPSAARPRPTGGPAAPAASLITQNVSVLSNAGSAPARHSVAKPCPVCSKTPMVSPHEASCGHVACWNCWITALAKFACPTCGARTRRQQLQPKLSC